MNTILAEEMQSIHALTQKCVTPEQWEKMLAENPELASQATSTQRTSTQKCEHHSN